MMYSQPYHLYSLAVEGPPSPSYEGCESPSVMSDSFDPMDYIAHQAPLSMGFSRQEYWSGLPCPPPGDLPNSGIKPVSFSLLHWQAVIYLFTYFITSATWEGSIF